MNTTTKYLFFTRLVLYFTFVLRITQYLGGRSLVIDEARLALNIINKSYKELLGGLEPIQYAPVGFLWIEHLIVKLLGTSEYALRLWPLLAGLLSAFLFLLIMRKCANHCVTLIGMVIFAVSDGLIYYSSEVKQYSSDVTIAMLIILMMFTITQEGINFKNSVLLGVTGAIGVWISYPSVFVLAGGGIILGIQALRKLTNRSLLLLMCIYGMWVVSFAFCYKISLLPSLSVSDTAKFQKIWQGMFAPFPPHSISELKWYFKAPFQFFKNPPDFMLPGLFLFATLIGSISMWHTRRKFEVAFLLSPTVFALLGSALKIYPFFGRFLLFCIPNIFLLCAEGIDRLINSADRVTKWGGFILLLLVLLFPMGRTFQFLFQPRQREELRPIVEYLQKELRTNDIIYVYHGALPAFKYYTQEHGFNYISGIESEMDPIEYFQDIRGIPPKERIWFVFSHSCTSEGVNEEYLIVHYLNKIGEQKLSFKVTGAALYLYNLSKSNESKQIGEYYTTYIK